MAARWQRKRPMATGQPGLFPRDRRSWHLFCFKCGTAMLTFAYQARDSSGSSVSGVQEALNEENAINTLMTRGLMVLSIQQKSVTKASSKIGKVSETDTVLFTR